MRLRYIVIPGMILLALYGLFLGKYTRIWDDKHQVYYGTVIDKQQPTGISIHKHHGRVSIDDRFIVKFDSFGIKFMNVSPETWYKYKIGDRIGFRMMKPVWRENIPFFISSGFIILYLIVFLYLAYHLINFLENNVRW